MTLDRGVSLRAGVNPTPWIGYLAAGLCAAIALYFSLHSLHLAATLTKPMPYKDHWMFLMMDYFPYLDGEYSVSRLFAQVPNTEHRLVTTRLVLFADAIFFRMSGVFPIAVSYASLAGIAFMLSQLAVQPATRAAQALAFSIMLAITWSTAQYADLSWQYEVQFPLLHFFALATLFSLALALSKQGRSRHAWLAVAVVCDFFAIWSAGSGVFLTVPLLLLAIWMLALDRTLLLFMTLHVFMVAGFLADYRIDVANRQLHNWPGLSEYGNRIWRFIALPFSASAREATSLIGWIGFLLLLFFTVVATAKSLVKRLASDRNLCVLLAFAVFVVIEGALIAYTRRNVLDRHATISTMFTAAMLACLWRSLSLSSFPALRWGALGLAMLAIVAANDESFALKWRAHAAAIDKTIAAARAGDFADESLRYVTHHGWLPQALDRLRQERLGPFAATPGP